MNPVKLVVLLVMVGVLAAAVLQNQASWQVRYLWLTGEVPGIVLPFLTAAVGFFVGATLLVKCGSKEKLRGE